MKKQNRTKILLFAASLVCLTASGLYAQPVLEQQNPQSKEAQLLVQRAIDGVDAALRYAGTAVLEIDKGDKADKKLFTQSVCNVLITIVGKSSLSAYVPASAPKICETNTASDATGSHNFVLQLEGTLNEKIKSAPSLPDKDKEDLTSIVQVTLPNVRTYLTKARDYVRDVLKIIAESSKSVTDTKEPLFLVVALVSAAKGRVDDTFAYGGLLLVQNKLGTK
jgi:hypothetical protein